MRFKKSALTALCAVLCLATSAVSAQVAAPAPQAPTDLVQQASYTGQGFEPVLNAIRAQAGRAPIAESRRLAAAAQAHAEDMAARGYFSHQGPGGSTVSTRARRAGCDYNALAENIAYGAASADQVLRMWAGSSGHRTNMLGRGYNLYGVGQAGDIWVLMVADHC